MSKLLPGQDFTDGAGGMEPKHWYQVIFLASSCLVLGFPFRWWSQKSKHSGRKPICQRNKKLFSMMLLCTYCQFHQHFTYEFLYKHGFGSFFSSHMFVTCTWKKLPKQHPYKKCARIKLMKLTAGELVKLNSNFLSNDVCWQFFAWHTKLVKSTPGKQFEIRD